MNTKLYQALLKVQSKLGALKKDETNPYFKSKYVTLNAVREAILPVLTEAGIVLLQPITIRDGKHYVVTTLVHAESGESISGETEVISKSYTDAQQVGSGISYARRYGLMSLLCLSAEDDDGNSASGKSEPAQTTAQTAASPASQPQPTQKPTFKKPSFVKKTEQEEEL
jgi:hypothetical protein